MLNKIKCIIIISVKLLIILLMLNVIFYESERIGKFEFEISSGKWISPQERRPLESQGGFRIPESAQDIEIYVEDSLNDRFIYVSFRLLRSELNDFLATTNIKKLDLSRPSSMFITLPRELNWIIDRKENYLTGRDSKNRQGIIVNEYDKNCKIYLVIFLI